jgi:conjugal transfer mating pair stabilization protein TraG
LDFVARPESGGNYNAILGNAKNQTVKLTDMTLSEVAAFQRDMVKQGKESGAVGKYQIIGSTLQGLIKEMNLDPATDKFTPELQDRMAMQLLERRGFAQWKAGKLSDEEFANRVAQEWAGLPVVTGSKAGRSYYAGVGSNKAGVSTTAFLNAIKSARGAG